MSLLYYFTIYSPCKTRATSYLQPQPSPTTHLQQSVAASHSAFVFAEHPHFDVEGQLVAGELALF